MINNKKTYYQLILDRSGSMSSCAEEAVSGFNEQVQQIKSLQERYPEQEFLVSLTTFSGEMTLDVDRIKAGAVQELYVRGWSKFSRRKAGIEYRPSGRTALYDAIGHSISHLRREVDAEVAKDEATVVVVIITDGWENASREYSYASIQRLIGELEATEDWTFSYMGSTPDSVDIAVNLNIKERNAMYFEKRFIKKTYEDLSDNLDSYASEKQASRKPKDFLKK